MRGEARSGEGAPSPQGERVGRRGKSMAQRKSSALDMYLRLHCEADWREKRRRRLDAAADAGKGASGSRAAC